MRKASWSADVDQYYALGSAFTPILLQIAYPLYSSIIDHLQLLGLSQA